MQRDVPGQSRGLPFTAVLLAGALLAAALVCLGTEWFCHVVLHYDKAIYTNALRVELMPHPDLFGFYPRFAQLHTEAFFHSSVAYAFMYPASAVPIYQALYAAAPHILAGYLIFSFSVLGTAALLVIRALVRHGIAPVPASVYVLLTMVCSYPIWFALDQGNIEIVLWVLVAGGVALYWHRWGYAAAICFGLAAAIKIYPALFLVLPLYRRRWGQAALGGAVAASYSLGSLLYLGPTFSQASRGIGAGLDLYRRHFMLSLLDTTGTDHSLFALVKMVLRHHLAGARLERSLSIYLGTMSAVMLLLLLTRVRRLPLANQLAFCIVGCALLPPTAYEYTLLGMLTLECLLLFVLLDAARAERAVPGLACGLFCCVVCLMFLPEAIHNGYQFGGILKAITLLMLMGTVLRYPFAHSGHTAGDAPGAAANWSK